ncbi:MAG: hypothetical protein IJD92_03015 [Bacilli bacterium]|nr:hypothetical protein [Bacilli bacterium]
MNIEFVSKDNEAKVFDENNNGKKINNTDNIEEILIKENVIENMEKEIEQLKKDINNYNKSRRIPTWLPLTMFTILPLIINPIIMNELGVWNDIISNTILGINKLGPLLTVSITGFMIIPGSLMSLSFLLANKERNKYQKAREIKLEFLKKDIVNQRELLNELKNNKTLSEENKDFKVQKVNDLEQLKSLRACLLLCEHIAYNEKKWYKYYQEGKLAKKMEKYWNESGVEMAKDYFEEKGPILAKKYDKK